MREINHLFSSQRKMLDMTKWINSKKYTLLVHSKLKFAVVYRVLHDFRHLLRILQFIHT